MSITFSYKLTDTDIYAHLMYRIHKKDAVSLDSADVLGETQKAVNSCNEWLGHKECNILIYADSFATIPEQGVGGRCSEPDTILIFIDPANKGGVKDNVKNWLASAVYHEMCHARRYVTNPTAITLGEALIEEGLASLFEEFMDPKIKVPYAHNLNRQEIVSTWEKAQLLLSEKNLDRDEWFYGGNKIKNWAGYSLGYDIVRKYMTKKSISNPSDVIDVPASEFLDSYKPE